jgi:hypothetical protein
MKITYNVISNITAGFVLHHGRIPSRSQQGLPRARLMTHQKGILSTSQDVIFEANEVLRRPSRSESEHTRFKLEGGEKGW